MSKGVFGVNDGGLCRGEVARIQPARGECPERCTRTT